MGYMMKCRECGEFFSSSKLQNRYCSDECRREAKKRKNRKYREQNREVLAYKARYKARAKKKAGLTIQEICKRAKAEGLSYGKYGL